VNREYFLQNVDSALADSGGFGPGGALGKQNFLPQLPSSRDMYKKMSTKSVIIIHIAHA